jgi:hypothetical protein
LPCNCGSSDISVLQYLTLDISVPSCYISTKVYLGLSTERMRVSPVRECLHTAALLLLYYCFTAVLLGHACSHRRHSSRDTFSGTGARQSVSIRTFLPIKANQYLYFCTSKASKVSTRRQRAAHAHAADGERVLVLRRRIYTAALLALLVQRKRVFVPRRRIHSVREVHRRRKVLTLLDLLVQKYASTASSRYTGATSMTPAAAAASVFAPLYQ